MLGSGEQQCKKILEKNHYETVRKLGKGSQGHVLLTSKFVNTVTFYAIKCISLKKCAKYPQIKRYINQQTQTMCKLDHPNIVRLQNSFADSGWHFLVMQYCDMGNLLQYQSKNSQKCLSLAQSLKFLHQIMKGVKIIHSYNIIHRDLKCQNIFLKKKKGGGYLCKIGDFGFAKVLDQKAKTNCGTVLYMAPEIMAKKPYDQKVDIWSLGVIFYYMVFGQYPFKTLNIQKQIEDKCKEGYNILQYQKIQSKDKKVSAILQDFFQKIFTLDQVQRISLSELFLHPIFKSADIEVTSDSTTDDQLQQDLQWEIDRIKFIKNMSHKLATQKFLPQYLVYASAFYLSKACYMFLHQKYIDKYMKEQTHSKYSNLFRQIISQTEKQINSYYKILAKFKIDLETIPRFCDGYNTQFQDFNQMKQGYRNTVGKVYELIHKKIQGQKKQAQLKFMIFCCHLINRVFNFSTKEQIFPKYCAWLQKKKFPESSNRLVQFNKFEEWVVSQSTENLLISIEILNNKFYKKE